MQASASRPHTDEAHGQERDVRCATAHIPSTQRALVEPIMPMLSHSWQRDRLTFGDNGKFAPPGGRSRAEMFAIDLVDFRNSARAGPSLTQIGEGRILQ